MEALRNSTTEALSFCCIACGFYSRFQDLNIKYRVKEAKRTDEITSVLTVWGVNLLPIFL